MIPPLHVTVSTSTIRTHFILSFVALLSSSILACSSSTTAKRDRTPKPIPTVEEVAKTQSPQTCTLLKWQDGDTPLVDCGEAEPTVVRMLGIDTPETGFDKYSKKRGQRQVEWWGLTLEQVFSCGKAASAHAKKLCPAGSEVSVVGTKKGKYGRRLAYILCGDINVNTKLVEDGMAGAYPYPGDPEKPSGCD